MRTLGVRRWLARVRYYSGERCSGLQLPVCERLAVSRGCFVCEKREGSRGPKASDTFFALKAPALQSRTQPIASRSRAPLERARPTRRGSALTAPTSARSIAARGVRRAAAPHVEYRPPDAGQDLAERPVLPSRSPAAALLLPLHGRAATRERGRAREQAMAFPPPGGGYPRPLGAPMPGMHPMPMMPGPYGARACDHAGGGGGGRKRTQRRLGRCLGLLLKRPRRGSGVRRTAACRQGAASSSPACSPARRRRRRARARTHARARTRTRTSNTHTKKNTRTHTHYQACRCRRRTTPWAA